MAKTNIMDTSFDRTIFYRMIIFLVYIDNNNFSVITSYKSLFFQENEAIFSVSYFNILNIFHGSNYTVYDSEMTKVSVFNFA